MYIILILLLGVWSAVCDDDFPTVKIPDGNLRGQYSTSYDGNKYMEFIGVPYAKPPLGPLRFEDPQPPEPWPGTWIANISTMCLQINHWPEPEGGKTDGLEDCLHLNVFVPGTKIDPTKNLDVIMHFHSGAFNFCNGLCYAGPKFLMDRDVILVTINFRLGLMGFLSTGDKHLPGNLGMKDQVMSLKWLEKNIKSFGGNPDSVTITGLSAGSASTQYHYLSPLSKGLYKQGISMSGTGLNAWTLQEEPLKTAIIVGEELGCTDKDTEMLVKCIKSRNGAQINEVTRKLRKWLFNPSSPVAVVVDSSSTDPFLPEHPYKLLAEGKVNDVPWLASVTTDEGLYPGADFVVKDHFLDDLEKRWDELAPPLLHYRFTVPDEKKTEVNNKIKNHYLKGKPISKATYPELIELLSDRNYLYDMEVTARLTAKANKSPVYFYQYGYTAEKRISFAYLFTDKKEKYGVCHGDDALFIFSDRPKDIQEKMTPKDEQMKNFMLDIWISFIKTGKPSQAFWTPVSRNQTDRFNYLFIGPDQEVELRTASELGHRSFWESLPIEENAHLFPNL